jgi:hypothetical protein
MVSRFDPGIGRINRAVTLLAVSNLQMRIDNLAD